MIRKLTILTIVIFGLLSLKGQELQFSQYYAASLYLNPAFAGVYGSPNFSINYRQQTPGLAGKEALMQASFVFPITIGDFSEQIGGVGITASNSQQLGAINVSGYYLSYAHNFELGIVSPDLIIVAAQGGMEFVDFSPSKFKWGSQSSPYLRGGVDPTISGPVTEFDKRSMYYVANAGVVYFYNRDRNYLLYKYSAFSGLSVTNLNRPDKSLNKDNTYIAPILFKYHGSLEVKLGGLYVMPSILALYSSLDFQFNGGAYISYPTEINRGFSLDSRGLELIMGTWYRFRDSFIFILGFNNDQMGARVSYDLNSKLFINQDVQDLPNASQPAFEISLQYNLNRSNRLRNVSNPLF